jgi:hypothetical protein
MPAKPHAPLLRPAVINTNTASANYGLIDSWDPDTTNAPAANTQYGIVVTSPAHKLGGALTPLGYFHAEKVWNSVWNDYADFQLVNDEIIPGKCYFDTADGAQICSERCQLSVIGIATDTFAQAVGLRRDQNQIPIAVAGWALAYVDKEYPCGTPLTNDENGNLTEITLEEKRNYPERIVGIYKRKELDLEFGTETSKIKVDGRHWIKIK